MTLGSTLQTAALLFGVATLPFSATAVPLDENMLNVTAEQVAAGNGDIHRLRREELLPVAMVWRTEIAFELPINTEWDYVDDKGGHIPDPVAEFSIIGDEPLASVLVKIADASEGLLEAEWVEQTICFLTSSDAYPTENLLDTMVTLDVEGVSTWEALKRLGQALNRQAESERILGLNLLGLGEGVIPPAVFTDDNSINIRVTDVPARVVLCQILAKSPLPISYHYRNHFVEKLYPASEPYSHHVAYITFIFSYPYGRRSPGGSDLRETLFWVDEFRKVYEIE